MVIEKKGIGIIPTGQVYFIDHLAVVCSIMGIPLAFTEEQDHSMGVRYYPGLNAQLVEYQHLTPEYLIDHYDVLFLSDQWDRFSFHQKYALLEKKYKKQLRHVHCPHGFSDKAFYLSDCAKEDIILVYGQNMLDMFKYCGVADQINSYVISNNYRFTYFKQNRQFYDRIVQEEVLSRFKRPQPVIMYAPTWLDKDQSSTFFEATESLIDQLPPEYNMIVKLHPRLELDDIVLFYQILGKYEDRGNVIFLKDFPLVYPLLAHTDLYIGDTSSVGYDFLAFNKPMFFLNKNRLDSKKDRSVLLFQCGLEIYPEDYSRVFKIIAEKLPNDQDRFGKIRTALYQYTFGNEKPFTDIKKDIIEAYNKPLNLGGN